MQKLFPILVILALVTGVSQSARAEKETTKSVEILTAIDVTTLMEKGTSSAEIANTLAKQRGIDRTAPSLKGKSDEQIIYYLLAKPKAATKVVDKGKSITYKSEGETYYKKLQYDKAAQKFTLAMIYSDTNHDLYKLRGDSYKKYLTTNFSPDSSSTRDEATQVLFDKKRKLMCNSIHADYRTASNLVDKRIQENITESNKLMERMVEIQEGTDPTLQYKKKSAANIISMRLMRRVNYQQNVAKQAGTQLKKAIADYKVVCGKEDAERRELIKRERDTTRDEKWVEFSEKDGASSFYDKTNLLKAKGSSTAWLRIENSDDVASYDLNKVTLDCTKRTISTLESSRYDETGKRMTIKQPEKTLVKRVLPGSSEELLFGKVCK